MLTTKTQLARTFLQFPARGRSPNRQDVFKTYSDTDALALLDSANALMNEIPDGAASYAEIVPYLLSSPSSKVAYLGAQKVLLLENAAKPFMLDEKFLKQAIVVACDNVAPEDMQKFYTMFASKDLRRKIGQKGLKKIVDGAIETGTTFPRIAAAIALGKTLGEETVIDFDVDKAMLDGATHLLGKDDDMVDLLSLAAFEYRSESIKADTLLDIATIVSQQDPMTPRAFLTLLNANVELAEAPNEVLLNRVLDNPDLEVDKHTATELLNTVTNIMGNDISPDAYTKLIKATLVGAVGSYNVDGALKNINKLHTARPELDTDGVISEIFSLYNSIYLDYCQPINTYFANLTTRENSPITPALAKNLLDMVPTIGQKNGVLATHLEQRADKLTPAPAAPKTGGVDELEM